MNYRMIKNILGWILLFEALFLAVPTITAVIYTESAGFAYGASMLICIACGALLMIGKPTSRTLYARDGFVIVALSWITMSIFGALPLFMCGDIPSYVDAIFETVSGFTTTGASILTSVEAMSKATLMWRSFTHWIGGMGVLVFIMAFLPLSGARNMHIMKAESPGPSVSKLVPRVKTTALILYSIYLILTVLEFVLLLVGGMPVFDALCTSFATAGTGGFSVRNSSIGEYSPFLQIVVTVFMLLFSLNFNSYYLLWKRKFKDAFNKEIRWFLVIVFVAIVTITINICNMFGSIGEALRHASFSVASIISTTGFMTVDFDLWPELSRTVLVLLMFIGACAGSTGGGIKISRIIILFKGLGRELRHLIHPHEVRQIKIDDRPVESEIVRTVNSYFVCYIIVFTISLIAISFDNHDLITSFTAVSATINNVGPGLELIGPTQNFAFFSVPSKLVLIFDMLAGRLELFPMLLLFTPITWKK